MALKRDRWVKFEDRYYQKKPDMFGYRRVAVIEDFGRIKYLEKIRIDKLPEHIKRLIPKEFLELPIKAHNYHKERSLDPRQKRKSVWTWGHPGRKDNQYLKRKLKKNVHKE